MNIKKLVKKFTPSFLLGVYHYCLALCGAVIFGFPSRRLYIIGVTGTSGKSTTVDFITRILEEAGHKVASSSSVRFKVGEREWKNTMKMTMPGRFVIQKFLKQALRERCQYAVIEVTSEGIKQFRHKFIYFDASVFLNLTPEHIDSHGSFEKYRNAKLQLFKVAKKLHIVNRDDENASYFLDIPAQKTLTFGLHDADVVASNIETNDGVLRFTVDDTSFSLNLLGQFNVMNALASISVAKSQGISLDVCKKALEKVEGMPGRLEVVSKEPLVVVDYAFTPEQLTASYQSVKNFSGQKNLVCVLGACGGGRDKWKRPVLGKIASENCREIIITNEDPYDEDPLEIMEQVGSGIENKDYSIVLDRKEAIKKALELVKPEDAVIITGKGAEPLMCLKDGKKIPWDDRQVVRDLISGRI